ncbi:hypothetical protein niasHS_009549 [Heterodera schachtii]|uniref:Uncharacterized protein n=1 Tax=Heterodera schachtii TaxID=97005 RepID=A0ABD2JEV4_HETSC
MQMTIFLSTICCFLFLANHLQSVTADYKSATVYFPGKNHLNIEICPESDKKSSKRLKTTKENERQILKLHKSRWIKYDKTARIYFTDVTIDGKHEELGSAPVELLRKSDVVLDLSTGTGTYYADGQSY